MNWNMWIISLFFAALAPFLPVGPAWGQTSFELRPESRFWIEGSSTVNRFTCTAGEVTGGGRIENEVIRNASLISKSSAEAHFEIPVLSFDCGKDRMNEDMHRALKAAEHPQVQFELDRATLSSLPSGPDEWARVSATGWITLAGARLPVTLEVEGRQLADGIYRVRGSKAMRMTDFGVKPPTAILGLVKAHDEIVVHFDLVAACRLLVAEAREQGVSGDWKELQKIAEARPCEQEIAAGGSAHSH